MNVLFAVVAVLIVLVVWALRHQDEMHRDAARRNAREYEERWWPW